MRVATTSKKSPASPPRSQADGWRKVRPRRILIDCTATFRCDFAGGIQRVVRNLVNSAEALSSELQLECQGVVYGPDLGFLPLNNLPVPTELSGAAFERADQPRAHQPITSARPKPTAVRLKHGVRDALASVGMLEPAQRIRRFLWRPTPLLPVAAAPVPCASARATCCCYPILAGARPTSGTASMPRSNRAPSWLPSCTTSFPCGSPNCAASLSRRTFANGGIGSAAAPIR